MEKLSILIMLIWTLPQTCWGQQIPPQPSTQIDQVADAAARLVKIYLQASTDLVTQRLSGPSYQGKVPNVIQQLLLNFAIQKNDPKLIDQIFKNARSGVSRRTIEPVDDATLLASTDARPGPVTPPERASFVSHLSLLYGVQLIGKGGKESDSFGSSKTKMTYLEPTASVLYNYDLPNKKGLLFGGLGIYVAYGLWGKEDYTFRQTKQSYPVFGDQGGYNRFDAGLVFTAGYQLPQGLRLSIAHEFGLVNIESGGGEDKTFNRVWSLNVAYPLKKLVGLVKKNKTQASI